MPLVSTEVERGLLFGTIGRRRVFGLIAFAIESEFSFLEETTRLTVFFFCSSSSRSPPLATVFLCFNGVVVEPFVVALLAFL